MLAELAQVLGIAFSLFLILYSLKHPIFGVLGAGIITFTFKDLLADPSTAWLIMAVWIFVLYNIYRRGRL